MDASARPVPRKRLGQFFSGPAVGRLLAELAQAADAARIVDPMAGSGDLLQACLDAGATPSQLAGIEIDAKAFATARRRLPEAALVRGDAFKTAILEQLPARRWDLVIGNPPFVRYQETANAAGDMTTAAAVRRNLLAALDYLDEGDPGHTSLLQATRRYSGHADLAVPACLLAMAMVDEGGRIGLVLPATFLSRDYAEPVRTCLAELFQLEQIVEDAGATWFPEALVKTILLVARRARGPSITGKIVIGQADRSPHSLVGGLFPGHPAPERAFAAALRTGSPLKARSERLSLLEDEGPDCRGTLADLGVMVGQGFRSGANDFFYVRRLGEGRARTSALFDERVLELPDEVMKPAIRDQRSSSGTGESGWAVLDLRRFALPEDRVSSDQSDYTPMPAELAAHVRTAARTLAGKAGRKAPIPRLSAVRTNVRAARPGQPARFWYMLPDFQDRHLPDVILPRVSAERPRALILPGRAVLADANFITLRASERLPAPALLALLNSTWAWSELERLGTVLGGGALKLESATLRRLAVPTLSPSQIGALDRLGCQQRADRPAAPWREADLILGGVDEAAQVEASALARLNARNPSARLSGSRHD